MSYTPFAHAESLRIGTVDFVSPNEVKVLLDIEAPDAVALNAGEARPFPRVNSYVLIAVDDGYLVGQIEWVTIERSPFPKRRGVQDFGLIDLPYPLRKMSLNPVGALRKSSGSKQQDAYSFRRGAEALPSVGSAVLMPTEVQLHAIVESGEHKRVVIGSSPLAGNATVAIDPDRLFGRHLAVLGNTGSGKSCSVAGLIRWCLEAAKAQRVGQSKPNARFIVLDPNGEYSRAFSSSDPSIPARIFKVRPEAGELALKVTMWFWNSSEWTSFTQASARTQRPTLIQALRYVRSGQLEAPDDQSHQLRQFLRTLVVTIRLEIAAGSPWAKFPRPKSFFEKLDKWRISLESDLPNLSGDELARLRALVDKLEAARAARQGQYPKWDFSREEANDILGAARDAHAAFGGSDAETELLDVDAPLPFTGETLLRTVEATAEMLNVSEHVETLLIRIRSLLKDKRLIQIVGGSDDMTLDQWLADTIGASNAENGCVSIIDLSLVPTEVVHIIAASVARIVFEALQRYVKLNKVSLPTVLVMEEAHTFVRRYKDDIENPDAATICCQVFEKISREGRKFGLGLVLSSQRPSELSQTVLSQCNTFLLHRISNDRDQELVHRLVPDNLKGLLRELPSLPAQHSILLGWASELPVLVKMNELPRRHQPRSDDPDFWDVWRGHDDRDKLVTRESDWTGLVEDWRAS